MTTLLLSCSLTLLLCACTPEKTEDYPQHELTIEYSFPTNNLLIGDQVELLITAHYPTNGLLTVPELGFKKDVVQLSRQWNTERTEQGLNRTDIRYNLTSFRIGEHPISTSNIVCTLEASELIKPFPSLTMKVVSALENEEDTQVSDIKETAKLPHRIPRWVWLIPATALLAFLVGLIIARFVHQKPQVKKGPPPLPPHLLALKALEALRARQLLEKDEYGAFYTELSLILRTYLEGRFDLHAPESTTEEIVVEMSKSPELKETQRTILQAFMRQADMVKFAKDHPDAQTMERAFDTTKAFVIETKQIQTENPENNS
jgi:hypothetical protein